MWEHIFYVSYIKTGNAYHTAQPKENDKNAATQPVFEKSHLSASVLKYRWNDTKKEKTIQQISC